MMKAGTYYVGDLCYVMHDVWDEVCNLMFPTNEMVDGELQLSNGKVFAVYGTAYGDGTYYDQTGREYLVDAGIIGCILLSDINFDDKSNEVSGGQVKEFARDFDTHSEQGVIFIGGIAINTGDEDEEDEDYWGDEHDDDTYEE